MGSTAKQTNQIYQEPSRWYRRRGFGLGPFGEKWWVAPLNRDKIAPMDLDEIPVTAAGMEVIEVCVQPVSATPLVVYRPAFGSPRSFADVD